ncbi:MAG: hypothetical protein ABW034_03420 [Steroidobacteraceae bacterium]
MLARQKAVALRQRKTRLIFDLDRLGSAIKRVGCRSPDGFVRIDRWSPLIGYC